MRRTVSPQLSEDNQMAASVQAHAPLRLLAEDAEDLAIISAALQDAVTHVGDIDYRPAERTLTVAFNRFCWERVDAARGERVRVGLQLGDVQRVQARKVRCGAKDAVLSLLAIEFEPGGPPGGSIILHFAGGGDIRVEVECIDAVLADVSAPWRCKGAPRHELPPADASPRT
jgi:hypothetical protein